MLGGLPHRQGKTPVIEQIQTQTDQMDEWSRNAPSVSEAKEAITAPLLMGVFPPNGVIVPALVAVAIGTPTQVFQ